MKDNFDGTYYHGELRGVLLRYDPLAGTMERRFSKGWRKIGKMIESGYVRAWIGSKMEYIHRVVYYLLRGHMPEIGEVEHIAPGYESKSDNRLANLGIHDDTEQLPRAQGNNLSRHKAGCLPGATYVRRGNCWRSRMAVNGVPIEIGRFATEQEAHEAYLEYYNSPELQQQLFREKEGKIGLSRACKPVVNLDTGMLYPSGSHAAYYTPGADTSAISAVCSKVVYKRGTGTWRRKTSGGYRWAFIVDVWPDAIPKKKKGKTA